MSRGLEDSPDRLITRNLILVSVAAFVFFAAFHVLVPVLPLFVQAIGGGATDIGLVVGSFTISSFTIRLFVGPRLDTRGRRGVLLGGMVAFAVGMALLMLANSVLAVFFVRIFQGIGWGATNTALNTLIADMAPPNRRGEAMGVFGAVLNVAMAIGPAAGLALTVTTGFLGVFVIATCLSVVAVLASLPVVETRKQARGAAQAPELSGLNRFFNREALQPSATMFLVALTFGAMMPFLPVYAGAETVGIFYVVYAVTLLASRPITGRMSDLYGRKVVLAPSIGVAAAGVFALSLSNELAAVLATAVLYGVGFGAVFPTLSALTVDLCAVSQRGTAMATLTAAFDMGVAVGSMLFGVVIDMASYQAGFVGAALVGLMGLVYFVATAPTPRRIQPE